MKAALDRARELQRGGMPCWDARCQASREMGCSVGDINRAYSQEREKLRKAKEDFEREQFESRKNKPKPFEQSDQQMEIFNMFRWFA